MSTAASSAASILVETLARWSAAVASGDTTRVAELYTSNVVFQGLRPGPERERTGISGYYAHQPVGLTPTLTPLSVRSLDKNRILGFLAVDFAAPGRPVVETHLTVLLTRIEDDWLIEHYHVSLRPNPLS